MYPICVAQSRTWAVMLGYSQQAASIRGVQSHLSLMLAFLHNLVADLDVLQGMHSHVLPGQSG